MWCAIARKSKEAFILLKRTRESKAQGPCLTQHFFQVVCEIQVRLLALSLCDVAAVDFNVEARPSLQCLARPPNERHKSNALLATDIPGW